MKRKLTSQDIAQLAGVSQSTVSRVIRGLPNVDDATREHVLVTIRKHGYIPSAAARSMKTNRNGNIAVVVANLTNPLYPSLLHHLVASLAARGLHTTIWETPGDLDNAAARAIAESAVDGVIFGAAIDTTLPQHEIIARTKPTILLHRSLTSEDFDTVVSDNRGGGALVAHHFAQAGRRHIGYVTGQSPASTVHEREHGFLETLQSHRGKMKCSLSDYSFDIFTYENGYHAARQLLTKHPDIDAVFCSNDILAIGAQDGARSIGRRVPEDLWIVGYDDIPMSGWHAISLSTVRQPLMAMTKLAVDRLCDRIAQPDLPPSTVKLPNELIIRRSAAKQ